jgi:hypothetical protein
MGSNATHAPASNGAQRRSVGLEWCSSHHVQVEKPAKTPTFIFVSSSAAVTVPASRAQRPVRPAAMHR